MKIEIRTEIILYVYQRLIIWTFYAHWHPDIEVLYVLEGRVVAGINSEERILHTNQMSICSRK